MNSFFECLSAMQSNGRKVVGCFPLYPPLELIHSMGLSPVVLWGLKPHWESAPLSDRHVQGYACSVGRLLAEGVLEDRGRLLDALLAINSCDTLRNLPEILEAGLGDAAPPIYTLHVPAVDLDRQAARDYLRDRIQDLVLWLETTFKTGFSPQAFERSTALYAKLRSLMRAGQDKAAQGRGSFTEYVRVCQLIWASPVEEAVQALEAFVNGPDMEPAGAVPVALSGILPPPDGVLEAVEGAGLCVAANDLAPLHRFCAASPEPCGDPAAYYTAFYRGHFPCTTLLHLADKRLQALDGLVDGARARGFIFAGEKFCEHEYFEYPFLEKHLKARGVKTLALEFSLGGANSLGGVKTRIEAFAEMLRGGA